MLTDEIKASLMGPALENEVDAKLEILKYLREIAEIRNQNDFWIGLSE